MSTYLKISTPLVKHIAIGPELKIFSVETGSETKCPLATMVRWLKWSQYEAISLLAVQQANSKTVKFFFELYHSVEVIIGDVVIQDLFLSDDLSSMFVLDDQGKLTTFATGWTLSSVEILRESLGFHRVAVQKKNSWSAFADSVKKYAAGIKWAVDKLRSTEPSGDTEAAILALALLTDSSDNAHLNKLRKCTPTREAYKYRDQLVRCFEDMRSKFVALGLCIKDSEPFNCIFDSIEKQLKSFLAWFLSRTPLLV